MHPDTSEIKYAKTLNRDGRNKELKKLRIRGIYEHNNKRGGGFDSDFQVARRYKGPSVQTNHFCCSECKQFLSKKNFRSHNCVGDNPELKKRLSLTGGYKTTTAFKAVLGGLHQDTIGIYISNNSTIQKIGSDIFESTFKAKRKEREAARVARQKMRSLGALFMRMEEIAKTEEINFDSEFVFESKNLELMRLAIEEMTSGKNISVKRNFVYAVKKGAGVIKNLFLISGDEDKSEKTKKFISCFDHIYNYVFIEVRTEAQNRRDEKGRRPSNLPEEDDLSRLRVHLEQRLGEMRDSLDTCSYIDLRRYLHCRLILHNARRVNEVSLLKIQDAEAALKGEWTERDDDNGMITYVSGKSKDVPVIIPHSLEVFLKKIISPNKRKEGRIPSANKFVFASSNSEYQTSGYHDMLTVTTKLNIKIKSTGIRHLMSTRRAEEMGDDEDEVFYDHLGHSGKVNKLVYQVPKAKRTLQNVGKFLEKMDDRILKKRRTASEVSVPGCSYLTEKESNGQDNVEEEEQNRRREEEAAEAAGDHSYYPTDDEEDDQNERSNPIPRKAKWSRILRYSSTEDDSEEDNQTGKADPNRKKKGNDRRVLNFDSTNDDSEGENENLEKTPTPRKANGRRNLRWTQSEGESIRKYFSDKRCSNQNLLYFMKNSYLPTLKKFDSKRKLVFLRDKVNNEKKSKTKI